MIQGAYIIGTTDEETGKQKIYFRTQPNNQRRLFDLVFKEAPKQSNLYILAGGSLGSGKALALDTPIATPVGWTTMGEIRPGDRVFSDDGSIVNVVSTSTVMTGHDCFEVIFSDGSKIVADAEHE